MLYVSSTSVQGGQVIEIVVNDPSASSVTIDNTPLIAEFNGTDLQLVQVQDGSWVAYLADLSSATVLDALADTDFGTDCVKTLDSSVAAPNTFSEANVNTFLEDTTCADTGASNNRSPFDVLVDEPTAVAVRSTSNTAAPTLHGQVGLDPMQWPQTQRVFEWL
jgi:hypothetical protein